MELVSFSNMEPMDGPSVAPMNSELIIWLNASVRVEGTVQSVM